MLTHRLIYAFDSAADAQKQVAALRKLGMGQDDISLVARSDIEMAKIPEEMLDVRMDFVPAVGRGVAIGGATGLVAGLLAAVFPPLGIAIAGPALLSFFVGGALIGAWSGALVGSSVPDDVRRKFEDEIARGRVLLVVDSAGDPQDVEISRYLDGLRNSHLLWQGEIGATEAV